MKTIENSYYRLMTIAVLLLLVLVGISCQKDTVFERKPIKTPDSQYVTLKSGVVVEKRGNAYFIGGDVALSKPQLLSLEENGTLFPEKTSKPVSHKEQREDAIRFKNIGVYPTPYNLWSMVRYTLATNLSNYTKARITEAINHWESQTNVRFYNATGQPTVDPVWGFAYPYVQFTQSDRNDSNVGRIGGMQILNIADYQPTRVVIHEIGHAIGLYHEMSRPDRDFYVNLNLDNLKADLPRSNFDKLWTNYYMLGAFDFQSVMMYAPFNGARNPQIPVITRKDGSTAHIGNAAVLSENDRKWANAFYLPYVARSMYTESWHRWYIKPIIPLWILGKESNCRVN